MNTEDNKLIVEFMGGKVRDDLTCENYTQIEIPRWAFIVYDLDVLKVTGYLYYSSWDWLIPVVEKIEDIQDGDEGDGIRGHIYDVEIKQNACFIDNAGIEQQGDSKIQAVYYAVVSFIEWFNKQK